jgi:RNA polymerase sigma-70 factor (ECF subfamily)
MNVSTERKLLARAQKSAAGFGELFDAYFERIYAYAYRRVGTHVAADDIAASVFEDALRGIKRFRWQGKPLAAWLYRIAARRVADYYRDRRDDVALESEWLSAEMEIGGDLERGEEYAAVRRALETLNAQDREIILLSFFDELDGAEIAATLNCATNNVYVRLHRALKRLETLLKGEAQDG